MKCNLFIIWGALLLSNDDNWSKPFALIFPKVENQVFDVTDTLGNLKKNYIKSGCDEKLGFEFFCSWNIDQSSSDCCYMSQIIVHDHKLNSE